jgi:hypothetical protein
MTPRSALRAALPAVAVMLVVGTLISAAPLAAHGAVRRADSTTTSAPVQQCPKGVPTPEAQVSFERPAPTPTPTPAASPGDATLVASKVPARVRRAYHELPLAFVPNAGQTDRGVRYSAQGDGFAYFFTPGAAVLSFRQAARGQVIRLRPVDANPAAVLEARRALPATVSYFRGSARYTNLAAYEELVYRDLWPGIDLVFHGRGSRLKYEFHVAPGADPSRIRMAYDGARDVSLGPHGALQLDTALGVLRDPEPRSAQVIDGTRVAVSSRYVLDHATKTFGFALHSYDPRRALVIDPGPGYSTLIGGSSNDFGIDIAVDRAGNAYVTGQTISPDFPTTPGAYDRVHGGSADAFVAKLDASGTKLDYATYLGGSGAEAGLSIAVDDGGRPYVSGGSASADFPTTPGAFDRTHKRNEDAWVAKLSATGSDLVYSTLLPGNEIAGDFGAAIAVDRTGHAYVAGGSGSPDFPSTPPSFDPTHNGEVNSLDAFVVKLKPDGSGLEFATFLGGHCNDAVTGIALDGHDRIIVTGSTVSRDFPTTANAYDRVYRGDEDVFVSELSGDGRRLLESTYLGGKGYDWAQGIALDKAGEATVTGWTKSADFPTTRRAFDKRYHGGEDAFVARLNAAGSKLVYSTYLGGAGNDRGRGVAVDTAGNAYVTGATASADFPTTPGARTRKHVGDQDAFVTKLDPSGSRLGYSTFLGGTALDFGRSIAVDADRNAYITGRTESADFPTSATVADTTSGNREAFVVQLDRHGR